jgi:hypothetical protein
MAEHSDFWKGVVTGTLAGMVFAAYARGDFRRLFQLETGRPGTEGWSPMGNSTDSFRDHLPENGKGPLLRRESSESAGDPTRLSPARATGGSGLHAVDIARPGGAPGRLDAAEVLEIPGHPGQLLDQSDAAQPVHAANRALNLSSSDKDAKAIHDIAL